MGGGVKRARERGERRVTLGGVAFVLSGDPELAGRAAELADSMPDNTERAYRGHIERFDRFCTDNGLDPWSPATVADYLAAMFDAKGNGPIALRQCATALRAAYRCTGREDHHPSWAKVVRGAVKEWVERGKPSGEALPLRMDTLHASARALRREGTPRALRDRALLLLGWSAGLRAAELLALNRDDVGPTVGGDGLEVRIRGTKTNRTTTEWAHLPARDEAATCPLAAWNEWDRARPASFGFNGEPAWLGTGRSGRLNDKRLAGEHAVTRAIHRALVAADIEDPGYTSHSLRAGVATELAERGVGLQAIANVGRWKNVNTVLRYARRARAMKDSPLHVLGG